MKNLAIEVEKLDEMYTGEKSLINFFDFFSKNNKKFYESNYKGFIIISEKSVELLNTLFYLVLNSTKKNWKDYYWTQLLLIKNTIPLFYQARKNLLDGFYNTASMNIRSSFESLLRLYFINFNPKKFNLIFGNEGKRQIKDNGKKVKDFPSFNIKNFIENDLGVDWNNTIYHILSNDSHSDIISIMSDIAEIEKGNYDIKINVDTVIDFSFYINVYLMVSYGFLKYINEFLINNIDIANDKVKKIIKTKNYLLLVFEKSLKHNLKKDVDNIMEKIIKLENKINYNFDENN